MKIDLEKVKTIRKKETTITYELILEELDYHSIHTITLRLSEKEFEQLKESFNKI